MFSALSDKLVVTGKTFGRVTSDGRCFENPTSIPISVYSIFPLSKYAGCGEWASDSNKPFKFYNVEGDDSHVIINSNFGTIVFKTFDIRTNTIKIQKFEDIMDDRAVFQVTDDGWKIVNVFAFEYDFPDMAGFNTYAYKNNQIRKCKITMENDKIKYDIFE